MVGPVKELSRVCKLKSSLTRTHESRLPQGLEERITDRMTPLESAVTVPAYFVALVEIHDPAGFQSYHEQFEATLAPFGGRLVSFGAAIVPLEGMDGLTARAAIVVFPSLQLGRDWFESPACQRIAPLRQRSARTRGFFVEGLPVLKQ